MSKEHKSPFRKGSKLGKVFGFMRSKQVYTRNDLLAWTKENVTEGDEKKASALVTILLTPRAEGESKGDVRGNPAVWGELWFNEKLAHEVGSDFKFRIKWRKVALDPVRKSVRKQKFVSEKTESAPVEPKVEVPIHETV